MMNIQNTVYKISTIIFLPAVFVHEHLHYIAALALRCKPVLKMGLEKSSVEYDAGGDNNKRIFINMFPTVIVLGSVLGFIAAGLEPNVTMHPINVYSWVSIAIMGYPSMQDIAPLLTQKGKNYYSCDNK